jgi:hypothetical protein
MVLAGITKGRCHGRIEACEGGGAFLIESISPQEILTPEDFTEEQRLIAQYDRTITTIGRFVTEIGKHWKTIQMVFQESLLHKESE